MSEIAKTMANQMVDIVSTEIYNLEQELQNNTQGMREQIKMAATNLINNYNKYQLLIQDYNNEAKKYAAKYRAATMGMTREQRKQVDLSGLEQARAAALRAYEALNMEKVEKVLIQLQKNVQTLQSLITGLSGISIDMVYVVSDAGGREVIDLSQFNLKDIVSQDRAALSHGGAIKLRYDDTKIKALLQAMSKQKRNKVIMQSTVKPLLDNFYKEIQYRWQVAKANNSNYILWKQGADWYKAEVSAFGNIEETYASIFLQTQMTGQIPDFLTKGSMDDKIGAYARGWLSQVTNAPGALIEDILIEGTGQFFGVKSAGASVAGIQPLYRLAKIIKSSLEKTRNTGKFTQRQRASTIKQLSGGSSINGKIMKVVLPEAEKAVQEIEQHLQKMGK